MTRLLALLAALGASFVLASCGGGGGGGSSKPPQGPPDARHPASDVASELAAEQMRVHLLVAARLYNNGRYGFANQQMAAAQKEYAKLTDAVRIRDGALDREFHAAFPVIFGQIAQRAPVIPVMNRMGLMQGQLLDAAISDSMSKAGFNDPGVTASVMAQLAAQGAREYSQAASVGQFSDRGKQLYQDAFGLITRASSLSHRISTYLGPQRGAIINGLNDAHEKGFPTGVLVPKKLDVAAVTGGVARSNAGVSQRFGFSTSG
ncbi:MAG TPA: hypothetical protein VH817_12935 [Thermoleophilaceae bacterium]